jgi:hypothetical protein
VQVRAFGLFARDILQRLQPSPDSVQELQDLVDSCASCQPASRPAFSEVVDQLRSLMVEE